MNRRTFLHAAGATSLGLSGGLDAAEEQTPVGALARLLEESPRESLPRELVQRIRGGLGQEELLAALSLAAVRNVQPYPDVGFKYHSVMVLRSIEAATRQVGSADKWLPLIWAVDYFKSTQAEEHAAGGWHQPTRSATAGVSAVEARRRLISALDRWDQDAADAAIVAYAASAPAAEILRLLFAYGARDLRAIGHKAITVSNAHSLIALLGGAHVTPILRSTVAALQNDDAGPNPADHDLAPDRPYRRNEPQLTRIPHSWRQGRSDAGARSEFRAALYRVSPPEAGAAVIGMLSRGIAPGELWQVLFDVAAELITVQPSILTLHAQTSANALHYAYRECADERVQQLALLQGAAFIAMFRAQSGIGERDFRLEALEPVPLDRRDAIDEIFAEVSAGRRMQAARKTLGYLQSGGDSQALIAAVRHHVVYRAVEPHDYKYPEAVFDTWTNVAERAWRERFLSAGMALFKGPARRASGVVEEARELLGH